MTNRKLTILASAMALALGTTVSAQSDTAGSATQAQAATATMATPVQQGHAARQAAQAQAAQQSQAAQAQAAQQSQAAQTQAAQNQAAQSQAAQQAAQQDTPPPGVLPPSAQAQTDPVSPNPVSPTRTPAPDQPTISGQTANVPARDQADLPPNQPDLATFDADSDGFVSRSELAAEPNLSARFDTLDTDRDGRLSPAEFASVERQPPTATGRSFADLDANADGVIERDELASDPELSAGFDRLDTNADQQLTTNELDRFISSPATTEQRADDRFDPLISSTPATGLRSFGSLDTDNDGFVTVTDLGAPALARNFGTFDLDNDNRLSRTEFDAMRQSLDPASQTPVVGQTVTGAAPTEDLFAQLDIDDDGELSVAELRLAGPGITALLGDFDLDGNNALSRREFMAARGSGALAASDFDDDVDIEER